MLKDLILASRSYRSFDESVKITRENLLDWIDHARLSPSSMNLQMLKYRIVLTDAECAMMLKNTRWAGKIKDQQIPPVGHAPTAYIVICADKQVSHAADTFLKDVGICAQSIMLAAAESGFGGCMIGSFDATATRADLALAESLVPLLVLGLGKPDEEVRLVDPAADGSVTYYRENGVHYVQKRPLEELVIE